jgi:hypothetical protein
VIHLTIKRLSILSLAVALPVLLIASLFNFLQPTQAAVPNIYRVAKTGNGPDGSSWTLAYTDVQDALAIAVSGDEIWVAKGVYTPTGTRTQSTRILVFLVIGLEPTTSFV